MFRTCVAVQGLIRTNKKKTYDNKKILEKHIKISFAPIHSDADSAHLVWAIQLIKAVQVRLWSIESFGKHKYTHPKSYYCVVIVIIEPSRTKTRKSNICSNCPISTTIFEKLRLHVMLCVYAIGVQMTHTHTQLVIKRFIGDEWHYFWVLIH